MIMLNTDKLWDLLNFLCQMFWLIRIIQVYLNGNKICLVCQACLGSIFPILALVYKFVAGRLGQKRNPI